MKKFQRFKAIKILLLGCVFSLTLIAPNVMASDDNIDFSFYIKPAYGFSRISADEARYRQTTNTNNCWKVNLKTSDEGSGDVTRFWLILNSNNTQVSYHLDAAQGAGAVYGSAAETASKQWVALAGENNNYYLSGYNISGFWDEETN